MTVHRLDRRAHVLVVAKAPIPGQVKSRLCPPLSPSQAAEVAEAALSDTLETVSRCGADRKVLALAGRPGPWLPGGFEVIEQRGSSFDERLAAAWADAGGPGLQIGMDTPQVTVELLDRCLAATFAPGVTAGLGPATDGGWWALGLSQRWEIDVFTGVPMSTSGTGSAQLRRLTAAGHRVAALPALADFDYFPDACDLAAAVPESGFGRTMRGLFAEGWAS